MTAPPHSAADPTTAAQGRSKRLPWAVLAALTAAPLAWVACTDATYGVPDLPPGWSAATHVDRVTQSACNGFAVESPPEQVTATIGDGTVELRYANARFRCQQEVEAFARSEGTLIDVLVQPINLDPPLVARCDCAYDVTITLPAIKQTRLNPGNYQLNVLRRWDNINQPNDPVPVSNAVVTLP